MTQLLKTYSQVFLSEGLENPQKTYAERRRAHLKNIDSICVYKSVQIESGERICQHPEFLYLTGINQSGAILVLNPHAKNSKEKEILFLAEKNAKKEFWNGIRLGLPDSQAKEITGFKTIFPLKEFNSWLKKKRVKNLKDFSKTLITQRIILEPERIAMARKAQSIAKNAFLKILSHIKNYKHERVLAAELECLMLSQTNTGLSFPSIVAAGKNACTLHYAKRDCEIEDGNLILLDFGCRYNTVCCDISRTIPVNGKFNPLQKLLYNIVLDTQKFNEKNVKPGLTLAELGKEAWLFMEELLIKRFSEQGGKFKRCYNDKPHGISHLIGDIVHEGAPNRDYLKEPLKPGMLISNEPGLYGHFELEINGVLYSEDIGIRIEDDLLITKKGCENLSKEIPKEIGDLAIAG